MRPTPSRFAISIPRGLVARGAAAMAIAAATACAGTVAAAGGSTPLPRTAPAGVLARAAVVPVPGDSYAPPWTSITFRGVTPAMLRGLSVVGSASGRHPGTLRFSPGAVAVFTPSRPFAGGERVTVEAPGLDVTGVAGAAYSFVTARPAPPAKAAAALRLAAATDTAGAGAAKGAAPVRANAPYTPPACPTSTYRSEPNLHAQAVCMNTGVATQGTEPGTYLFLTPGLDGAGIWSDNGDLVWWQGTCCGQTALDESVVQYAGTPYIAVWEGFSGTYGKGQVTLFNEHYQEAGVVTAGAGFAGDEIDLHEFQITPAGDALVGVYEPVETANGSTVLQYVVEELSLVQDSTGIHTGAVLFEWDSLLDVPVSQSYEPGTSGGLFDYFHGNAISQDSNGDLIVSARNTWGLYELDTDPSDSTTFGHVLWEVGAKGDTSLSPEPWCYQHDIVALGNGRYSLFDDGGVGPSCQHPSRGLIISITPPSNGTPASVTLDGAYPHSPAISAGFTGSTQVLPNGNVVVDWANIPEISEYSSPGGTPLMDLSMSSNSYRGTRSPWVGEPLTPPSVAVTTAGGDTTVYASWNGSTQVTGWRVLGGTSPAHLVPVSIPYGKTNFETAVPFTGVYPYLQVEALDSNRNVLATTPVMATAGYVLATSTGAVVGGGDAAGVSSAGRAGIGKAVGIAEVPGGGGYWVASSAGGVFTSGNAPFHGSLAGVTLKAPVVGIAASPAHGYWLVSSDGGIFCFGLAHFRGSAGSLHLNRPIVGMAPTPDGNGYWLVASDGGIFSYGDARFHGSAGSAHLTSPIVGMAATADGGGYWLFAQNGQVYPYGDAPSFGSATASQLGGTVAAAGAAPDHQGYWLVSSTGRVLGFGDAPTYGAVTLPPGQVVGISAA